MTQKRILLAEDEAHIAKLVEFKLGKEGYAVELASNGGVAIEKLRTEPQGFALLILDVMMPVADGWEVLRFVRTESAVKGLPVLMLTAKGHQKDMANAAELGATQFLKKPFDPTELARLVRKLVGDPK
ncbi:MAG: response regulator transcription factor [Bdellovibrionales bacterium]|nr:response regulator transcription factor [Bdellovibrionales bacterium]